MQTDATSHNIARPNNVGSCWHLLALVGTCCVVHANKRNNCQCWQLVVILALITALSVPVFSSICYRPSHFFSSNNSLCLTRPRGKSFLREGQSAVPPRGLAVFWCIYSRFSIFCLTVSCFLKLFAQLSLIRHLYNNPEITKHATIVCFLKKKITRRVSRRFHEANIVGVPCKRAQHCCTFRRSHNNRNVGACWAKLYATSANKCQHCCVSMQTDATSHNIVGPNNVGSCWPTMLRPFAWAFRSTSCNSP